jgi:hypothetical protein
MLHYKPAMPTYEVETNNLHLHCRYKYQPGKSPTAAFVRSKPREIGLPTTCVRYGRMPIDSVMRKPLIITSNDSILATLNFRPYRSRVERRVIPFLPGANEPQTMEINTPWGAQLTAHRGDFLVSELDAPNDYWPIDPVIFEESYRLLRPGYCVKKAITLLVPLTDITRGNPDQMVTVVSLEGAETVRAGDFWLAKGIKGEIWPYPHEKINDVMVPAD